MNQIAERRHEVRRSLGFLLQETSRLVRRRFVQRAREVGLSLNRSEAKVLTHVFHAPGMSQAAVANLMDIDTISLVRLVDSLQAAGLIERRAHATDRRIRTLWLTEAAEPVIRQIKAVTTVVRAQAIRTLSDEHHELLLDLLLQVRANLATADDELDQATRSVELENL